MANKVGSSTFGINFAIFGLIDDDGKLIADATKGVSETGLILVDEPAQGVMTANITALEAAGTKQFANNQAKRVTHGAQQPQIALTMLDLPGDVSNKMLGYNVDANGGAVLDIPGKPNVAMLIASHDFYGNYFFDGFANGELIMAARNHGTNNANETDANATYTYSALTPIADGIFADPHGNQMPYKTWNSGHASFSSSEMLKEVFGGYTGDDLIAKRMGKQTPMQSQPVTTGQ